MGNEFSKKTHQDSGVPPESLGCWTTQGEGFGIDISEIGVKAK